MKRPVYARVEEGIIEILDEMAEGEFGGTSRSEVVRTLLFAHLTDCLGVYDPPERNPKGGE